MSQQDCPYTLSGKIIEAKRKISLPSATVYIEELNKGVQSDSTGSFVFKGLCNGRYQLTINYSGYISDTILVTISGKNYHKHFYLKDDVLLNNEVTILSGAVEKRELISQAQTDIKGKELLLTRGSTLGEVMKTLSGVYVLQSGPSLFKPVIHGLHSNRILLLNNGVRQEGQQWGSEHAPEIDPFIATRLSVIKGPASIRYGSDAIGGVILVDPALMPTSPGISGELNLVGASNNRLGVASGIVQGALGKKLSGLSWRTQGTYRRAGNAETPDYFLANTGFKEYNFSGTLNYKRENIGAEIYYSQFNTSLGIFTGTHAETVPDINAAIGRSRPITPSYFSFTIDRPYQKIKHTLFKASAHYRFKGNSRMELVFARQHNVRSEYDYVPLSGKTNPELYLSLVSHTLDLTYHHAPVNHLSGSIGFNGITQGNVRQYEMLIPNFRNYGAGVFLLERWRKKRISIEAGVRYDYRWLRSYMLDNNTAKIITPTFHWQNITGSVGSQYYLTDNLSWLINIGNAWRAPTVNELLSNGVHQSAVAYERGNISLKSEKSLTASTSLKYQGKKLIAEVDIYNTYIEGYIYLKPALGFIRTARGAYPLFDYTQVNAVFRGVDMSLTYNILDSLSIISKTSLLFARNATTKNYLQLVPANRFENTLKFMAGNLGKVKQIFLSSSFVYTARQTRVPANSDYTPPPGGYLLIHADMGFYFLTRGQQVSVNFSANNIFNTAYRDYMDRFRYFMDEPGRNFTLRIRIPFQIIKEKK